MDYYESDERDYAEDFAFIADACFIDWHSRG